LIFLIGVSLLLVWWSWRLDNTRRLFWLVLAAAFAQALVSGGLFALSLSPPDFLRAKVLGPGFWAPFADAEIYFLKGQQVIQEGLPTASRHTPSALYVSLLGLASLGTSHSLFAGLWLNTLLHLALMPLVFQVFQGFASGPALSVALGLGFLPSGILYTSQLLREPLIWLLLFTILACILTLNQKIEVGRKLFLFFGLFLSIALLTEMRDMLGYVILGATLCETLLEFRKKAVASSLIIIGAVAGGAFLGKTSPASFLLEAKMAKPALQNKMYEQTYSICMEPKAILENPLQPSASCALPNQIISYWNLSRQRVMQKWEDAIQGKNKFFLAIIFFDLVWLAFWNKKTLNSKIKNDVSCLRLRFLVILFFATALSIGIFSENLGNGARHLTTALFLIFPILAFRTFWKNATF